MDRWVLHWLEASGNLSDYRSELICNFEAAYTTISKLLLPPGLDILVQRMEGGTIPEMGILGYAHRSNLFTVTVDPSNPNFTASLSLGALQRQIIHEVHHCMRMAGPGYGSTLGEALVTEGLAGQFVRQLLGSAPEPWECAIPIQTLRNSPVSRKTLEDTNYDHNSWFFGSNSHPKWLGYTLGYEMVGRWLESAGEIDAKTWVNIAAETVIEPAARDGLVSQ